MRKKFLKMFFFGRTLEFCGKFANFFSKALFENSSALCPWSFGLGRRAFLSLALIGFILGRCVLGLGFFLYQYLKHRFTSYLRPVPVLCWSVLYCRLEMATAQRTRLRAVVGVPRRAAWQLKSALRHSVSAACNKFLHFLLLP